MKKFVVLVLCLLFMLTMFIGCSGQDGAESADSQQTSGDEGTAPASEDEGTTPVSEEESYKIGLSVDTIDSGFWEANFQAIRDYCDKLGYELVEVVANGDANTQNEQVSDLISQGCNAIIIAPNDGEAINTAVAECVNANIPVVMNNRPCTGDAVPSASVLSDNYTMSYNEMTWFINKAKEDGVTYDNAIMLIGGLSDENAVERYDGYSKAIEDNPGVVNVAVEINTDWDLPTALSGLQNALQSNPDIDMIIIPSDTQWTVVQSALEEAGKWAKIGEENNVACISFDGDSDGMQMIYDGYSYADAAQAATGTGIACVDLCTYFLEGGAALEDPNQRDAGVLVNIDNYDDVKTDVWSYSGVVEE